MYFNFGASIYLTFLMNFYRSHESSDQTRERLDKDIERYHNLPEEKREANLENKREYMQNDRAKESKLRRSTRLEADRANKRIQQALKSTKDREKDAHAKWKQRYKK